MATYEFKSESKRMLDLMINSIYTHKEIFLREIISNASDALDKLYYKSLSDDNIEFDREKFYIRITPDKDARTLTITDGGIGMNRDELKKTSVQSQRAALSHLNRRTKNAMMLT